MDGRLFDELLPSTVVGAIVVCVGMMFLVIQQRTVASIGLSGAWVCAGSAMISLPQYLDRVDPDAVPVLARAELLLLAGALASSSMYLAGLARTAQTSRRARRILQRATTTALLLSGTLAMLVVLFPAQALNDYQHSLGEPGFASRAGFWLFASFWIIVGVVFSPGWTVLARQRLDVGEQTRATTSAMAIPLLVLTPVVPYRLAVWVFAVAAVIMLMGVFRFHAAQGERAAFLSRFLSPHVAQQVRRDGLTTVMRPGELVLTVVACDLRGFTSYAEAVPSQAVIDLLNDYYAAVGDAVAVVDGTVKDYAGDGILVLVGAPLPREDHAEAGLRLARRIHDLTRPVLDRWATGPHPLGIGVGVATGRVTVGAIGSSARMEYAAVGTPVNLAARLCSHAAAGETLVDETTAAAAGAPDVAPREPVLVKGLSTAVPIFELLHTGEA